MPESTKTARHTAPAKKSWLNRLIFSLNVLAAFVGCGFAYVACQGPMMWMCLGFAICQLLLKFYSSYFYFQKNQQSHSKEISSNKKSHLIHAVVFLLQLGAMAGHIYIRYWGIQILFAKLGYPMPLAIAMSALIITLMCIGSLLRNILRDGKDESETFKWFKARLKKMSFGRFLMIVLGGWLVLEGSLLAISGAVMNTGSFTLSNLIHNPYILLIGMSITVVALLAVMAKCINNQANTCIVVCMIEAMTISFLICESTRLAFMHQPLLAVILAAAACVALAQILGNFLYLHRYFKRKQHTNDQKNAPKTHHTSSCLWSLMILIMLMAASGIFMNKFVSTHLILFNDGYSNQTIWIICLIFSSFFAFKTFCEFYYNYNLYVQGQQTTHAVSAIHSKPSEPPSPKQPTDAQQHNRCPTTTGQRPLDHDKSAQSKDPSASVKSQ